MIHALKRAPMRILTQAEITSLLEYGFNGIRRHRRVSTMREALREECQYEMYADDLERDGDEE